MSASTSIEWTDATWSPLRARRKDTGKVGQHCERVSPGCTNCYAARHNGRNLPNGGTGLDYVRGSRDLVETFVDERVLAQPLRWREPKRIFVANQTDLFGEWVSDEQRDRVFAAMALAPRHTFQVLTKRPERMRAYLRDKRTQERTARASVFLVPNEMLAAKGLEPELQQEAMAGWANWPLPNVWLGVTAEDQQRADERIPILLDTPAAVRFVSVEPLLGPVNLGGAMKMDERDWLTRRTSHHLRADVEGMLRNRSFGGLQHDDGRAMSRDEARRELERLRDAGVKFIPCGTDCASFSSDTGCPGHRKPTLDWVIVGGESGGKSRPCDVAWLRSIVEQCRAAGVACFNKQLGSYAVWDQCGLVANNPPVPFSKVVVGGRELVRLQLSKKGGELDEFPADLRVREFPKARETVGA